MFVKHIAFFLGAGYFRDADDSETLSDLDTLNEGNDDKSDDNSDEESQDDDKDDESDSGDGDEDSGDESDKGDEGDEEEDKSDDDEEKDDKETNEETDEEEDKVVHVSDIKKAFPDFFKKFPDVKAALYRDQQYGNLFGTPKDAEVVVEKAGVFDQINEDLVSAGDPSKLLNAVKKENEKSYQKIALSILPYIAKNDKDLYLRVAALPIKQLLRAAFREGGKDEKGNLTNLAKAAQYVHQYYFDNLDIDKPLDIETTASDEKSEAQKEYEKKLQQINEKEYNNFFDSVNQSYVTRLSKEFRNGLENDERLSEWAKSKLVEDGLKEIQKQLASDPRYSNQMKSLWSQAKQAGYTNDFKSRILSTALARAKSLVPNLRSKLIKEALGKGKSKGDGKNKEEGKKINFKPRESNNNRNNDKTPKKPLTDLDILRGA